MTESYKNEISDLKLRIEEMKSEFKESEHNFSRQKLLIENNQ